MQVTLRVERYADQGRCVGHVDDGRVIFIRFALPGELVEVAVDLPVRSKQRFLTGEVSKVLEASPDRVEPAWPLAGPLAWGGGLGGADLVHVSLEGQLKWKADVIAQQMKRLGHHDLSVTPQRASGDVERGGLAWRTRIDLLTDESGRPAMRRRQSHQLLAINSMPLATEALNDLAGREGIWQGKLRAHSQVRLAVPQQPVGQPIGDNYGIVVDGKVVAGRRKVEEHLDLGGRDFSYEVDATGFWQVHRQAPLLLAQAVGEQVSSALSALAHPVIWDLYSGSGLFSLPLAALAGEQAQVLAVEGSRIAVAQARYNAERAGLADRITSISGDVAKTLSKGVDARVAHPDIVVLDPPRSGAAKEVCQLLAKSGTPCIVYVSCDPTSLARDTTTLTDLGYSLHSLQAFDIYPMTHHVETLAVFTSSAS